MHKMYSFFAAAVIACLALPALAEDKAYSAADDQAMLSCLAHFETSPPSDTMDSQAKPEKRQDCIGTVSNACMEQPGGSSTIGISECMSLETEWWDDRLNTLYGQLRETMDDETMFALRDAQRAWVNFRDTECSFLYTRWRDGTIRSTMYSGCMLDMTANRAIDLEILTLDDL